jgi:hypothetical protein
MAPGYIGNPEGSVSQIRPQSVSVCPAAGFAVGSEAGPEGAPVGMSDDADAAPAVAATELDGGDDVEPHAATASETRRRPARRSRRSVTEAC